MKKNKKVIIGVGIGCLFLLLCSLVTAGGYFLVDSVTEKDDNIEETTKSEKDENELDDEEPVESEEKDEYNGEIEIKRSADSTEEDGIVLALDYKVGDKYRYEVTMEQTITQEVNNEEMQVYQEIGTGYTLEVTEITDKGDFAISLTYDWISMLMESGGTKMEYDSREKKNASDEISKFFDAMLGKSFSITLSPQMEVKEVAGLDAIRDDIIAELEDLDDLGSIKLEDLLNEFLDDENMGQTYAQIGLIYPDEYVAEKDEWSRKVKTKIMFPVYFDITVKLEDIDEANEKAYITTTAEIETDSEKAVKISGMNFYYDLTGTQSSKNTVNLVNGHFDEAVVTQKLSGEMKTMGQSIPMYIETKSTSTAYKI